MESTKTYIKSIGRKIKQSLFSPVWRFRKIRNSWRIKRLNKRTYRKLPARKDQPNLIKSRQILERILTQNIIQFWYPEVLDREYGGYRFNHDIEGVWGGHINKNLIPQARTLWFFSKLANSPHGKKEHLEAAKYGFDFLSKSLWDRKSGGFYWQVDSTGDVPTVPEKYLVAQSFGLFALSEYAMVSKDDSARELARQLFNIFERIAYDSRNGGYQSLFDRDWNPIGKDTRVHFGVNDGSKTLNLHLHIMEALTVYYRLTNDQIAYRRLIELILIESNSVIRKTIGASTDKYHVNWKPVLSDKLSLINFGHDLENITLLIEACAAVDIPVFLLLDLYRTVFSYILKYGFDRVKGGFFRSAPIQTRDYYQEKIWWIQAEGLLCALNMYQVTREEVYLNCFAQTLDWINQYQVDWQNGEWFAQVYKNGKPAGFKADKWKTPYHNGRAALQSLEILGSLAETK